MTTDSAKVHWRPITIPELKNCDPSEGHIRTRQPLLGSEPPETAMCDDGVKILVDSTRLSLGVVSPRANFVYCLYNVLAILDVSHQ